MMCIPCFATFSDVVLLRCCVERTPISPLVRVDTGYSQEILSRAFPPFRANTGYSTRTFRYLLSKGNTHLDFKDQMCNNHVKLLMMSFADDTVVLSNSTDGFQNALNDLSRYCKEWKLVVNRSTINIMVFKKKKTFDYA